MRLPVLLVVLLLSGGGLISPVEAKPASPREQIEELRAIRARMRSQEFLVEPLLVSDSLQSLKLVQALFPTEPAPAPLVSVVPASSPTTASRLGGELNLAEVQKTTSEQFTPNSSLFGGNKTDVRIEMDYQGVPGQSHSKASVTLAPQGKPFLIQVTGEQTTGDCPAGPGGFCEYDSRKLDVYGAYRFWKNTTEGNIGPFVRFQDNSANGTWRSPDGLYSGFWKSDKTQTDVGMRFRLRHRLTPGASSNPWVGVGGEYDFANGSYDAFGEGGVRPGNPKNPWNLYVQGGFNSDGGYAYPEITTPNLIGDSNSKLQLQLQAKGVFYALGSDNSSSSLELGAPITLKLEGSTVIQAVPAYVLGLDSNTKSGFGGAVRVRIAF